MHGSARDGEILRLVCNQECLALNTGPAGNGTAKLLYLESQAHKLLGGLEGMPPP